MPIGHIMRHNTSEWRVSTLCCKPSRNTYLPDNQNVSTSTWAHEQNCTRWQRDNELFKRRMGQERYFVTGFETHHLPATKKISNKQVNPSWSDRDGAGKHARNSWKLLYPYQFIRKEVNNEICTTKNLEKKKNLYNVSILMISTI